jgi:hypothetical protein
MDHFRGSFGARAVVPLWRDGVNANVSCEWVARLSDRYGRPINGEALMAYCYALLVGRGYMRRFEEELRTPGPRVPITTDAGLFQTVVGLGRRLVRLHTYREVSVGGAREIAPVGVYPQRYAYVADQEMLLVGDGEFGPVSRDVWAYSVSGYPVLAGWLRQRIGKSRKSPLDAVRVDSWTRALSSELLELVWLIETTLTLEPRLDDVLGAVLSTTDRAGRC